MIKNLPSIRAWWIALVVLALVVSGCGVPLIAETTVRGSGNVITETREVSGFSAITLTGAGTLIIEQTGTESLTISTDDNILPYLTSEVRGNRLILGAREKTAFTFFKDLTYRVTVKTLDAFELTGAGSVELRGIQADRLQVISSGAGSITASGAVDRQEVTLSGAGSYQAEGLDSSEASVTLSGAGSAVVKVRDELNATISGLGSIEYIGDPRVTQDVSGLGSVSKR
jgi:hypothetical protein